MTQSVVDDVLIGPEANRRNGLIFIASSGLLFFAAPVIAVGVVQAALADKLGASALVANLPMSAYLLGALLPPVLSWVVPHRYTRATAVASNLVTATVLGVIAFLLFFPFSDTIRLVAVIGQGLIQGFSAYVSQVYRYQCLRRGTTVEGRASAFKWTYTWGPILAVAGSLWAQFVLGGGVPWLEYPYDFGVLYLIGVPSVAGVAFLCSRYQLVSVPEEKRPPFVQYFRTGIGAFVRDRTLVLLWLAFFMWFMLINAVPNLSLYTREVLGGDPKDYSGWIMAMRFGVKSVGGFVLGTMAIRWGIRSPLFASMVLLGAGILWGWTVPGYAYLFAFGLMGAGELGGSYFPNYAISFSSAADSTRNMSLLMLASPLSFFGPALHGVLADHFGFEASFTFALVAAIVSLFLLYPLPARRSQVSPEKEGAP